MHRCNTEACFEEIKAYFREEHPGYFLLVNTDNYNVYQDIRSRLEADPGNRCVYVSAYCSPGGVPDIDGALASVSGDGRYVLVGLSQALMLRSRGALEAKVDEVLHRSVRGHGVILLDHCDEILQPLMARDLRVERRVVLVEGRRSELPHIRVARTREECLVDDPFSEVPTLLQYLERLRVKESDPEEENARADQTARYQVLPMVSALPAAVFSNAMYPVQTVEGIYNALVMKYTSLAGATRKEYGTDDQWRWLAGKMAGKKRLSDLVNVEFGAAADLAARLKSVWRSGDKMREWLWWLAAKALGVTGHPYLALVLRQCDEAESFVKHVYLDLAAVDLQDPNFERYYEERKELLEDLPKTLTLVDAYCNEVERYGKNRVFYLTDGSDRERFDFMRCLSDYTYEPDEIDRAVKRLSRPLRQYMDGFVFNAINTKLPEADSGFRAELTDYFREYKLQKLTNRIFPDFQDKVDAYALSRPYNKLPARSSIVSHLDRKDGVCFFFDALGVEYLAFILAKCREYGMVAELAVGRCELPSITVQNKEFLQYFPQWNKIDELDDLKHENQKYDFQSCKYPIHLFEELDVIDKTLENIRNKLVGGNMEKAFVIADHGASRLAVLRSHEVEASVVLDDKGEHSGRCCPAAEDPHLPFAAYENGYAVLANYERFKGSRKADVEVHGGATLEEVLVPIITLTLRPADLKICFMEEDVTLRPRMPVTLVLYSNIPLARPRLLVNGSMYEGTFTEDTKHAKFEIPGIKRNGKYDAEVYDGDKNMSVKLTFTAKKKTQERELF